MCGGQLRCAFPAATAGSSFTTPRVRRVQRHFSGAHCDRFVHVEVPAEGVTIGARRKAELGADRCEGGLNRGDASTRGLHLSTFILNPAHSTTFRLDLTTFCGKRLVFQRQRWLRVS